jgi:hypothetical protein
MLSEAIYFVNINKEGAEDGHDTNRLYLYIYIYIYIYISNLNWSSVLRGEHAQKNIFIGGRRGDREEVRRYLYSITGSFCMCLFFFISSSLLTHLGACSRFWSIGLSFLRFLIRDSR